MEDEVGDDGLTAAERAEYAARQAARRPSLEGRRRWAGGKATLSDIELEAIAERRARKRGTRSFTEFAAEKKAEWNDDARAVYDAAAEAFARELGDDGLTQAERAELAARQASRRPSMEGRRTVQDHRGSMPADAEERDRVRRLLKEPEDD